MPAIRAQVTLRTKDNVPANFVTNSWGLTTDTVGTPDWNEIRNAFKLFYDNLDVFLSPSVAQNDHEVKFYALPGVQPNYPIAERFFSLSTNPAGTAMPSEVALVLAFQGVRTPGLEQARRRGRIYVGPLDTTTTSGERPTTAFRTAVVDAALAFDADLDTITPIVEWGVWSETNQAMVEIASGWVDDAWDTQRRRGLAPTTRTNFTV